MMHKILIAAAVFAVIVLGVAWYQLASTNVVPSDQGADVGSTPTATSSDSTPTTGTGGSQGGTGSNTGGSGSTGGGTTPTTKTYTLAQIATHASASSCWVTISSKVYDLTNWISRHPGGPDKILSICGTNATAAFTAQHSGDSRPPQELANFLIGDLQ